MSTAPNIVIVQDSREQRGYSELFTAPCAIGCLPTGDYSIRGLESLVSIERKSLPDLLQSLTRERERFERELYRGRALRFFAVIVECDASDILQGRFGRFSSVNPVAIWESIAAFSVRYAPFIYAGDRDTGARLCESLLMKFARECWLTARALDPGKLESHRVRHGLREGPLQQAAIL